MTPELRRYLSSPWAAWAQVFLAASCGTSAWVWHGRNEAWWWLWLLPAGLCLVTPTRVLL